MSARRTLNAGHGKMNGMTVWRGGWRRYSLNFKRFLDLIKGLIS